MNPYVHPARDAITLTGVLAALGDPTRLAIVRRLSKMRDGLSCSQACPIDEVPKSTLSNHYRVLRESGLIRMEKRGVENINTLRRDDLDARFPGLLESVLAVSE